MKKKKKVKRKKEQREKDEREKEKREKEERRKKDGCEQLFQVFDQPAKFYYSEFIQSLIQYGKYIEEKKNISAKKIQRYYKTKKKKDVCEKLFQFFYHRIKFYYSEFHQSLIECGKYIEEKKNISAKKIQRYYKAKKKKGGCEKLFQFFDHRIKFYYSEFIQNLKQYGEIKLYIEEKKNISAKKIQGYYKTKKKERKIIRRI